MRLGKVQQCVCFGVFWCRCGRDMEMSWVLVIGGGWMGDWGGVEGWSGGRLWWWVEWLGGGGGGGEGGFRILGGDGDVM